MPIYLAPWSWVTEPDMSYWQMPRADIGLGCLDLRSLPQCGSPGPTPQGYGLFSLREPDSKVGVLVADSLTSGLTLQTRRAVGTALNIGRDALTSVVDNPLALILQLYNRHADATGLTRWKPLRGSLRSGLKLAFENKQVYSAPLDATVLANTVAVFQADYRRNKAAGMNLETLRKWTGSEVRKLYGPKSDAEYDQLAAQIQPPEYVGDGQEAPSTVWTESFNQADSDTLGPDLTWVEIAGDWDVSSNRAASPTVAAIAYANAAVSSADHYSQATLHAFSGGGYGVIWRKDASSVQTFYLDEFTPPATWITYSVVSGSYTNIGVNTTVTGVDGDLMKGDALGSAISRYRNGSQQDTVTNTAITGNLYGGIWSNNSAAIVDVFEIGDLGAVGISPAVAMYHHRHHNKAG